MRASTYPPKKVYSIMDSIFERYTHWLIKKPFWALLLAASITIIFAWLGRNVDIEHNFSMLFSVDNEANDYRLNYRKQFGSEDGTLVAVIIADKLDGSLFSHLQSITTTLEDSQEYVHIISPTNASVIRGENEFLYIDPLFGDYDDNDMPLAKKITLLRESPNTIDRYISSTTNTVVITAEMPAEYGSFEDIQKPATFFQETINTAFASEKNIDIHYSGIAFSRIAVRQLMIGDLRLLVPIAALLMISLLYFIFKSPSFILITFASATFAQVCTRGLMGIYDENINQITITYPILLLVILVANNIHYFHRYASERNSGKTAEEAIFISVSQLTKAAFLSCMTTAIGFYALMTSDMQLLKSFGFYLGSGVIFTFIGMALIIPAGLTLIKPKVHASPKFELLAWVDKLVLLSITPKTRPMVILTGIIIMAMSIHTGQKANYNYFLSDMLDDDHPQVLAAKIMEEKLSGSIPLEVSIQGTENSFKETKNLQALDQLATWIKKQGYGNNNQSLASIVMALNKGISGQAIVPNDNNAIAQLLLLAEGSSDNVVEKLVDEDYAHARISVQTIDMGANALAKLKIDLAHYQKNHLSPLGLKARITGEVPVVYEGMNTLTHELIKSVLTALVFIIITIILLYRDWQLALGAIFPNILPLTVGLAIFALTGIGLNPLPGVVFCMGLGIAVDDTIHSFSRFNEERQAGKPRQQAIIDTVHHIKGALFTSSIIMSLGFMVFMFSQFSWTRDMGWLGAVLILVALFSDIIFTPAALSLGRNNRSKTD